MDVIPCLQVLACSSPKDKKVLVETLQSLSKIISAMGDGTDNGPALKTANVGFLTGVARTEAMKEASNIILMDENFSSIVKQQCGNIAIHSQDLAVPDLNQHYCGHHHLCLCCCVR